MALRDTVHYTKNKYVLTSTKIRISRCQIAAIDVLIFVRERENQAPVHRVHAAEKFYYSPAIPMELNGRQRYSGLGSWGCVLGFIKPKNRLAQCKTRRVKLLCTEETQKRARVASNYRCVLGTRPESTYYFLTRKHSIESC